MATEWDYAGLYAKAAARIRERRIPEDVKHVLIKALADYVDPKGSVLTAVALISILWESAQAQAEELAALKKRVAELEAKKG